MHLLPGVWQGRAEERRGELLPHQMWEVPRELGTRAGPLHRTEDGAHLTVELLQLF